MTKLLAFRGLERVRVDEAEAGDIIAVAGLEEATVADTIGAPELERAAAGQPVDPPTLAMTFRINDGPLAGREGNKVTSPQIRDAAVARGRGQRRHQASADTENRGLRGGRPRRAAAGRADRDRCAARASSSPIGRPRVLTRTNPDTGQREEPMEEVLVDVDEAYAGVVVEQISRRKGELRDMRPSGGGKLRLVFHARRAA